MCATRPQRCGDCLWSTWDGALKSLNGKPRSEMRRRLRSGRRSSGRRLKKNASAGRLSRICRRKRLSAHSDGSTNVGPERQDASVVPQLPQRSYLHDLCPHCFSRSRQVGSVCSLSSNEHHGRRGRRLSAPLAAPPPSTNRAFVGRWFDTSQAVGEGVPRQRSQAILRVPLPGVCPGAQSRRIRLDAKQALPVQRNAARH